MEGDNRELVQNTSDDRSILMALLTQGLVVGSVSALGSLSLGPSGGFLGVAAGALLALVRRLGLTSATASEWLVRLMENPLVRWVLGALSTVIGSWTSARLWNALQRLANFLRNLTQSGPPHLAITVPGGVQ